MNSREREGEGGDETNSAEKEKALMYGTTPEHTDMDDEEDNEEAAAAAAEAWDANNSFVQQLRRLSAAPLSPKSILHGRNSDVAHEDERLTISTFEAFLRKYGTTMLEVIDIASVHLSELYDVLYGNGEVDAMKRIRATMQNISINPKKYLKAYRRLRRTKMIPEIPTDQDFGGMLASYAYRTKSRKPITITQPTTAVERLQAAQNWTAVRWILSEWKETWAQDMHALYAQDDTLQSSRSLRESIQKMGRTWEDFMDELQDVLTELSSGREREMNDE